MRGKDGYDSMSADWQKELVDALTEYTDDVTEGVKEAVKDVAEETVAQLKKTSPKKAKGKKAGKYAKGWRVKDVRSTTTEKIVVVHNATDYQLTHLLENGHMNRDGSFTAARPHIAAAEAEATKNLEEKIKIKIKG